MKCDNCGTMIIDGDDVYEDDLNVYCSDCYNGFVHHGIVLPSRFLRTLRHKKEGE